MLAVAPIRPARRRRPPAARSRTRRQAHHPGDGQGYLRLRASRGDAATDEASRRGLIGLGRFLIARTAVEPGEPFGVNIADRRDHLLPDAVLAGAGRTRGRSPEATLTKIDAYMKQGGMIIFDTRDYGQGMPTGC